MKRFKKILFVAESEADNLSALQRAVHLATSNDADLSIVGVAGIKESEIKKVQHKIAPTELREALIAEKRDQLEAMVNTHSPVGKLAFNIKVLVGTAFLEVIREVLRNKHDIVIKAAEKPIGFSQSAFGRLDMKLIRKCPCPLWIVKSTEHEQYRRILAAVDHDPENEENDLLNRQILEMASSLAFTETSELHVVHAWSLFAEGLYRSPRTGLIDPEVDEMMQEERDARRKWLEDLVEIHCAWLYKDTAGKVQPQLHLIKGDAKYKVPQLSRELDVDIIVMGTVGRSGIPGFFIGNTAEQILEQIDCSGLVVKPPGFISPVSQA